MPLVLTTGSRENKKGGWHIATVSRFRFASVLSREGRRIPFPDRRLSESSLGEGIPDSQSPPLALPFPLSFTEQSTTTLHERPPDERRHGGRRRSGGSVRQPNWDSYENMGSWGTFACLLAGERETAVVACGGGVGALGMAPWTEVSSAILSSTKNSGNQPRMRLSTKPCYLPGNLNSSRQLPAILRSEPLPKQEGGKKQILGHDTKTNTYVWSSASAYHMLQ